MGWKGELDGEEDEGEDGSREEELGDDEEDFWPVRVPQMDMAGG